MFRPRIIPVLLLKNSGLVKSVRFRDHKYIGDPINAVKIFNESEADELVFLDIDATREERGVSLDFVRNVGEEASMPFSVGGGIRTLDDIKAVINAGAEKVIIGSQAAREPEFVRRAADEFGSSTIVVCIDVKRSYFKGQRVWCLNATRPTDLRPVEFAELMTEKGAGELIVQSVTRDGTMAGYDIDLIKSVTSEVDVPVIALGGAGEPSDLVNAYEEGDANALAAGSLFVYKDRKRGVLINYPAKGELLFDSFPVP
jgi:imidazole glycerol-phosphate synthase subunit HisF